MKSKKLTRRNFLAAAGSGVTLPLALGAAGVPAGLSEAFAYRGKDTEAAMKDRIVDMHVHFDADDPAFLDSLLKLCDKLNMTVCLLTPFANRKTVAEAAKQHPKTIVPFGFLDLDHPDVLRQAEEVHAMGFRGLGELEYVKKPFNDPSYFPVYDFANRKSWILLFHTGIVQRLKFDEPENVASWRMKPEHLDEIARRFPKVIVLGAHLGNPEYEMAGEAARWNPNVFFDLSGSSLTKMKNRLSEFTKIFWWSQTEWHSTTWKVKTPNNDPNAFIKLVYGSDVPVPEIESVIAQYRALFDACEVPERTRKMIMGGTMVQILGLPD